MNRDLRTMKKKEVRMPWSKGRMALFALVSFSLLWAASGCTGTGSAGENEDVVVTKYDPAKDFRAYTTFAIAPDVGLIGSDLQEGALLDKSIATPILDQVKGELEARGYVQSSLEQDPDLGVNVTLLRQLRQSVVAYPGGYWWGSSIYYPGPSYWGYPGYSYYAPWSYAVYSYQVGTLVVEIVDRRSATPPTALSPSPLRDPFPQPSRLDMVWSGFTVGVLSSDPNEVSRRAVAGVAQAFLQSPYFQR